MMQMDKPKCVTHLEKNIIFICLEESCGVKTRLGCERCLLMNHSKHIKCCVFIKDLQRKEVTSWSNNIDDNLVENFLTNKLITQNNLDSYFESLRSFIMNQMKDIKRSVIQKSVAGRNNVYLAAKQIINQFERNNQLKQKFIESLKNFLVTKSQEDAKEVATLSKQWAVDQERICKLLKGQKYDLQYPTLKQKYLYQLELSIKGTLGQLQQVITFQKTWIMVKSNLPLKFNGCSQITELVSGKQFLFTEKESHQLMYSNERMVEGKYEWKIKIEIIPEKIKTEANQEENKDDNEGGLLVQQIADNTFGGGFGFGQPQNTGVFSAPEYKFLGNFFVGVIDDSKKNNLSVYAQGQQQCMGVDLIKGQILGNMYQQGVSGQIPIATLFNQKKKSGLEVICTLDLNIKKFTIKEKEGKSGFECALQIPTMKNWRPFIYSQKSRVKVTLIN